MLNHNPLTKVYSEQINTALDFLARLDWSAIVSSVIVTLLVASIAYITTKIIPGVASKVSRYISRNVKSLKSHIRQTRERPQVILAREIEQVLADSSDSRFKITTFFSRRSQPSFVIEETDLSPTNDGRRVEVELSIPIDRIWELWLKHISNRPKRVCTIGEVTSELFAKRAELEDLAKELKSKTMHHSLISGEHVPDPATFIDIVKLDLELNELTLNRLENPITLPKGSLMLLRPASRINIIVISNRLDLQSQIGKDSKFSQNNEGVLFLGESSLRSTGRIQLATEQYEIREHRRKQYIYISKEATLIVKDEMSVNMYKLDLSDFNRLEDKLNSWGIW